MEFKADWKSLRKKSTPEWFKDAKFGIYTHWGIYSVPACGPNGTWYPYNMYIKGTEQYQHHLEKYGGPAKFGYKDFIPDFTAAKFDAAAWADLFKKAGAQFAGPVAEHHDGFSLWDSDINDWNAAEMGPKRDVVGELAQAVRDRGMRYMVALHHAANWWFFPHWVEKYDTSNPKYSGLYGPLHNQDLELPEDVDREKLWELQDKPSQKFLDMWLGKIKEVIDNYEPSYIWFDFGLDYIQEHYKKEFITYYYNKQQQWDKEVVVSYKWHHMVPGSSLIDLELGRFNELTYNDWITDTTVDVGGAWSYVKDADYKTPEQLVHYLIDNVSKNGYMLLNVGPKPNGEIPEPARKLLLALGKWLDVNGEAIYGTTPWMLYGEGPTEMKETGAFTEGEDIKFKAEDIRYTVKDNVLYAVSLGWPEDELILKEGAKKLYESEIKSIKMLGVDKELSWEYDREGLKIATPPEKPCQHAYVFKIERQRPF